MANDWQDTTLGDVCNLLTGFPFKSAQYTEARSGIRLVRGDNVVQGRLRWDGVKKWPCNEVDGLQQYSLQEDDVVLAMDRPWIDAGLKYAAISRHDLPALLVQRVSRLRGGSQLDTRFLKYLIGSEQFTNHVLAVQTGTAVPHISAGQIKSFSFRLPPVPTQKRIANILSTLDDKIELNRRMNETLEAMARRLFKSWFIDFDPVHAKAALRREHPKLSNADLSRRALPKMAPEIAELFPDSFEDSALGSIPKGWKVAGLGDVVEILDSKRIPLSGRERIERQGKYPYHGAASVMDHVDDFLFDGVHVLMGEDGSVVNDDGTPVLQYVWGKFWVNNHAHVLKGIAGVSSEHIYLHLKTSNISAFVTGAVQPKLNQGNLKRIAFLLPTLELNQNFEEIVAPWYAIVRGNSDETKELVKTRDRLLPRLLSGELKQ